MFVLILIISYCIQATTAFCNMNEITNIQKYMLLHSKPTTIILVNHMVDKYAKKSGISSDKIKSCIHTKKTEINKKKPNLRKRA